MRYSSSRSRRRCPFGAALLSVVLAAACDYEPTSPRPTVEPNPLPTFATAAAEGGTWVGRAPMPRGRVNLGAGVIPNARGVTIFYVIGGQNLRGDATTNVVHAYNPLLNSWATKARLPDDRVFPNGAGAINGKLYLTGGYDGATPTSDLGFTRRTLFVYDPATNTWVQKKLMPVSSAGGVTGVINGRLYVLTGVKYECQDCPTVTTRSLYRYNPATDTWTKLASAPNPHAGGVGGVINGKFYVAGGGGELEGPPDRRLHVYNPATNTWSSKAPMPLRDRGPGITGAVVAEKLYVTGGGSSAVDAYDPANDTWTRQTDVPDPARWDQAAGTIKDFRGNQQMIVVGAADQNFGPGETWIYTP